MGQWLRAERRAPALRGTAFHIHAALELCAPPSLRSCEKIEKPTEMQKILAGNQGLANRKFNDS